MVSVQAAIPNLPIWKPQKHVLILRNLHSPRYILPDVDPFRISQSFWMVSIFVPSLTLLWSNWKCKPPDCSYCTWFDPRCRVLWRCSDDPKEEDQRHHVATDGVCKVYTCLSGQSMFPNHQNERHKVKSTTQTSTLNDGWIIGPNTKRLSWHYHPSPIIKPQKKSATFPMNHETLVGSGSWILISGPISYYLLLPIAPQQNIPKQPTCGIVFYHQAILDK